MVEGVVSWDAKTVEDRSASPFHPQPILKILHDNDDHRVLNVAAEEHLIHIVVVQGRPRSSMNPSMNSSMSGNRSRKTMQIRWK
jgi:hypothetical protein